jgi:hypothetical protein
MLYFIYNFSTNISTEYFKHAAHSPFFSSKCRLFHNATFFGSCSIHILHTGCTKIYCFFFCEIQFMRSAANVTEHSLVRPGERGGVAFMFINEITFPRLASNLTIFLKYKTPS